MIGVINCPAAARCVAYRLDGAHLAVGFQDGTLNIYDYEGEGRPLVAHKEDRWEYIKCLVYSPDMRYLAVG